MLNRIITSLRYPSTWDGIVKLGTLIAGFAGYTVDPQLGAKIAAGGLALSGFISTFFSDADTAAKIESGK